MTADEARQASALPGVRSALDKHLVKTGRIPDEVGKAYRQLFKSRHMRDYDAMTRFTSDAAHHAIEDAERVVGALKQVLGTY